MSARPSARSAAKVNAENRMVKQREKEYEHQMKWNNQVQYYKSFDKTNNKFDEWTSPRYYDTNNQMIEDLKKKRQRKEQLEKRREKLRKLLEEENRTYDIEVMVKNRYKFLQAPKAGVPTEVLKDVHQGIKLAEDERRRHEAELSLYHQWRNNNPVLREHERVRSAKDLKLSWLDQQVEKRLETERTEEECRKMLAEREKRLEEEKAKHERMQKAIAEKNEKLRLELEKQVEELQIKQKQSEVLQKEEEEEAKKLRELFGLEDRHQAVEQLRENRELALENLKQHKMKLKQKAAIVQEDLEQEQNLIKNLLESQIADRIEDENKKQEVKKAMSEFLKFAREQQELERQRQKHFDFVFDSEAKLVYDRQHQVWLEEQKARKGLLKDVMDTVKQQMDDKIQKSKLKQRQVLEERQNSLKLVAEFDRDIRKNKEEEQHRKKEWKKELDAQVEDNRVRKKDEKIREQRQIDRELESARKEEERLRKEIVELQRRQGPIRHTRSRIFF